MSNDAKQMKFGGEARRVNRPVLARRSGRAKTIGA